MFVHHQAHLKCVLCFCYNTHIPVQYLVQYTIVIVVKRKEEVQYREHKIRRHQNFDLVYTQHYTFLLLFCFSARILATVTGGLS